MAFRTFKLDVSYQPLEITPWFDAFNLVLADRAEILWSYPEDSFKIRSQYEEWNCPSIIVLKNPVKRRPEKKNVFPSLRSILVRDMYTCQYCSARLSNSSGTRDHIIPESKGGKSSYTNLAAACKRCQARKSDKYLHEVPGMKLLRQPKAPKLSETLQNSIKIASNVERNSWKTGFKKLGMLEILGESE
jgi:5-methylcytosine-specific restriction endonuclease McrA